MIGEVIDTGGFTNHAVSQSSSDHRRLTKLSISAPARRTSSSSSTEPFSDLISLSIVIPQSARAGKQVGSVEGDGGGVRFPVKPQRPSWVIREATDLSMRSSWNTGIRVHINVCSTSGGTFRVVKVIVSLPVTHIFCVILTRIWPIVLDDADIFRGCIGCKIARCILWEGWQDLTNMGVHCMVRYWHRFWFWLSSVKGRRQQGKIIVFSPLQAEVHEVSYYHNHLEQGNISTTVNNSPIDPYSALMPTAHELYLFCSILSRLSIPRSLDMSVRQAFEPQQKLDSPGVDERLELRPGEFCGIVNQEFFPGRWSCAEWNILSRESVERCTRHGHLRREWSRVESFVRGEIFCPVAANLVACMAIRSEMVA